MGLGWQADVVADGVIASSWGNTVRDRTVIPFANAAARTSAIAVPKVGMLTWLDDVKRYEVWNGTAWSTEGLASGRRLGFASLTANSGGFAAFPGGNIGLTVTLSGMIAGRTLACRAEARISGVTTNASLAVRANGTQIMQADLFANGTVSITGWATSVAGTNTIEVWGWSGGGTVIIAASATAPATLAVTDAT